MLNIIMGLIFVIGGLSGQLALRWFDSPDLLVAIGAVMIVWGISQVRRGRRMEAEARASNDAENEPEFTSPEFTPPADPDDHAKDGHSAPQQ